MHRARAFAASVLALLLSASAVAAAATVRPVTIADNSFSPFTRTMIRGDYVRWTNGGSLTHSTTSTGALRWDRTVLSGGTYLYTGGGPGFYAAGIFPYFCKFHAGMTGRVSVPVSVSPASGPRGTRFTVRWATMTAPTGYRYQVQRRTPGSSVWTLWRTTTASAGSFATTATTPRGTYSFRARLQRLSGSTFVSSFFSFPASLSVT
jgi:plastocyanin